MATSRPLRDGDFVISLRTGGWTFWRPYYHAEFVLGADFGIHRCIPNYLTATSERIFGVSSAEGGLRSPQFAAAITNGTAPGLYVREGDDTSNWEVYRQVLARRVEEAMATRRGGEGGIGVGETTATPTTTRQDDEIHVGDVVEVVSWMGANTIPYDVGKGGRVTRIEHLPLDTRVHLESVTGLDLPIDNTASLVDVRKVTSPSSPQTVAATVSPIPDGEAARIEAAVTDEVRRSVSSPLAGSGDKTTRQRAVNPVPSVVSVQPRGFTSEGITDYLRSLGATHIRVSRTPEGVPVVEVTGLSQQALDTARQNLPVGIQLRAAGSVVGRRDSGDATAARIIRGVQSELLNPPPQPQQPTQPPSRFSLLEVDTDPSIDDASPLPLQAFKAPVDLAALQAELRAEREAKRALAAAQTPPGRFDLLECDLPAVPAAVMPTKAPPQRPVVSPPPRPRNPVETITDLTAARSPLELARMLEGLNDELSTMMRQREAN